MNQFAKFDPDRPSHLATYKEHIHGHIMHSMYKIVLLLS